MNYQFPKAARLRSRRDYQRFLHQSKRETGRLVIVEYRYGRALRPRLGITVTRKYGKSHDRNRFKRVVREAFRHCQHQLQTDLELIIKPRSAALEAHSTEIARELVEILSK